MSMQVAALSTSLTPAQKDRQALQGIWCYLDGRREAELIVAGDSFTVIFGDGDIYMGTYKLDASKKPRRITMTVVEGPERHRGKTFHGLYELIGGKMLKWCPGRPDSEEPPADFPHSTDDSQLMIVFEREKPGRGIRTAR